MMDGVGLADSAEGDDPDVPLTIDGDCELGDCGAPELGTVKLGPIEGSPLGVVDGGPGSLTGLVLVCEGGATVELLPDGWPELTGETPPELVADGVTESLEAGLDEADETGDPGDDDSPDGDTPDDSTEGVEEPAEGDGDELGRLEA